MLLRSLSYSLLGSVTGAVAALLVVLLTDLVFGSLPDVNRDAVVFGSVFGGLGLLIIGLLWDDGDWLWKDVPRP